MARFSNAEQAHSNARANALAKDRDPWVVFTDTSGAWNAERYRPDAPCHTGHDVTVYRRTYDKCDRFVVEWINSQPKETKVTEREWGMGPGTREERAWVEISFDGVPVIEIRHYGRSAEVYRIGVRAVSHAQAVQLADVSERYPIPEPAPSK